MPNTGLAGEYPIDHIEKSLAKVVIKYILLLAMNMVARQRASTGKSLSVQAKENKRMRFSAGKKGL